MSRTVHHNPELSAKYLRETSDALVRYLHPIEAYRALDAIAAELNASCSILDVRAADVFPYSAEELAWFRHSVIGGGL